MDRRPVTGKSHVDGTRPPSLRPTPAPFPRSAGFGEKHARQPGPGGGTSAVNPCRSRALPPQKRQRKPQPRLRRTALARPRIRGGSKGRGGQGGRPFDPGGGVCAQRHDGRSLLAALKGFEKGEASAPELGLAAPVGEGEGAGSGATRRFCSRASLPSVFPREASPPPPLALNPLPLHPNPGPYTQGPRRASAALYCSCRPSAPSSPSPRPSLLLACSVLSESSAVSRQTPHDRTPTRPRPTPWARRR